MGLDSLELLVSFEKYFNIQVFDLEAEKIRTVQEMVECIASHLKISDAGEELKLELFEKIRSQLIQIGIANQNLKLTDKIFILLNPNEKEKWKIISDRLHLNIPQPFIESNSIINNVFRTITWRARYNWQTITADQFNMLTIMKK